MRSSLVLLALWLTAAASVQAQTEVASTNLKLTFAANGDLLSAEACLPACDAEGRHEQALAQGTALVSFASYATEPFELNRSEDRAGVRLNFENPANGSFRRWRVPYDGFRLELESSGSEQVIVTAGTSLQPPEAAGFAGWLEQQRYVLLDDGDVAQRGLEEPPEGREIANWTGYRNRFWTVMVKPESPVTARFAGGEDLTEPGLALELNAQTANGMAFYLGPVEWDALKSADPALTDLIYAGLWFWLRWICLGLLWLLDWIQAVVPIWASAIMGLSLVVYLLMWPLNRLADRLQNEVHETEAKLAPELREIQAGYKGGEQSERILAMYKEHGVHPLYSLKSMAGIAVIIPVFIGAFNMLAENIWLSGESFLWVADLARPDAITALPFTIPFFGSTFNLLPFIMTGLTVAASRLHRPAVMDEIQARKHRRNLVLMATAFLALFYTFPAGMVLYWTTNNLISVIKYALQRKD